MMEHPPIHATAVAIDGWAVLLTGPPGAGKSDLALRLIDRGAMLVSDDYTVLTARDDQLIASPPATIAGKLEIRGFGIAALPYLPEAPVALIVHLEAETERMPEPRASTIAGVAIAAITLDSRAASAPIKLEIALRGVTET